MSDNSILDYSLNELQEQHPTESKFQSGLANRCSVACSKKLKDISVDELRMLIGQSFGLKYTVPLALSSLEEDPLSYAGLYKGDLLAVVLTVPEDFWKKYPILNNRLAEIRISVEDIYKTLSEDIMPRIVKINFI
jgi:hypothetical protein